MEAPDGEGRCQAVGLRMLADNGKVQVERSEKGFLFAADLGKV